MEISTNPQLELAFEYVRHTNKNIFLTGKAGTGKTTFLHQLKKEGSKRMVVTAPTGVAAINAGGMTLHSFFQLPFGLFVPGVSRDEIKQRKFSGDKIRTIKSVDLLVIDEISMVRADLLDSVDEVLRRFKDPTKPFGGVQLLMIGDLHQLPPVVKHEEWEILKDHYESPYFFGSHALRQTDPVTIELKHIYRQADQTFINLLNKVRDNQMDKQVLDALNERYQADFQPPPDQPYIILTAHNATANEINAQKLTALAQKAHKFKASVEGDFPPFMYPTEEELELKLGAQVMFIKNDIGQEKRFYNGKIGKITAISDDSIKVRCPDDDFDIHVERMDWENIKYALDEKTKEVKEDLLGVFTQFPLKLAWAITIHKSQGLTFDRAIIDAQSAFAHGQVYVALSRCKTLEGIVLRSRIEPYSVKTDSVVKGFSADAERNAPDEQHLENAKRAYQEALLEGLFQFRATKRALEQVQRVFTEHQGALSTAAHSEVMAMRATADTQVFDPAEKFIPQLQFYFTQGMMPEANEALQARIRKASEYFAEKLGTLLEAARNIPILTDNKELRKTTAEYLTRLQKEIFTKISCFNACKTGFEAQAVIRANTNADLDFQSSKKPEAAVPKVFKNTTHPELYNRLAAWRADMAETHDVELYQVLPTKSIMELIEFLPNTAGGLKRIKGIGEVKVRQFGADIIGIIEEYCKEKNIASNLMAIPDEPPKPPKEDTKRVSFDLFQSGKTIAEIAKERGFVVATIEGHLAHFVATGDLDITAVLAQDRINTIEAFFKKKPDGTSAEAKLSLGVAYSYGEIKMVQGWLRH